MQHLSTLRPHRALSSLLLGLGLLGCEPSNGILDVQMNLPANPIAQPMFVRVLVARGDFPVPENTLVPVEHELGVGPTTYEFSIEDPEVSCDPALPGDCDLLIEVRFCVERGCDSLCTGGTCATGRSDPQATIRYRLEQPLFVGQRTQWEPRVTTIPRCLDEPSICADVEEPADTDCVVDAEGAGGAPTWRCELGHCDHIICADDPGGAGGQCQGDGMGGGGRTGPHLCDR